MSGRGRPQRKRRAPAIFSPSSSPGSKNFRESFSTPSTKTNKLINKRKVPEHNSENTYPHVRNDGLDSPNLSDASFGSKFNRSSKIEQTPGAQSVTVSFPNSEEPKRDRVLDKEVSDSDYSPQFPAKNLFPFATSKKHSQNGKYVRPLQVPLLPTYDDTAVPVGATLSPSLKQKIINGNYVDFALLVDIDNLSDSDSDLEEGSFSLKNGNLKLSKAKTKNKVITFPDWVGAWNVFTCVFLESLQDLSYVFKFGKHLEIVRGLYKAGKDWRHYDLKFRKYVEAGVARWGVTKSELYDKSFLRVGSFGTNKRKTTVVQKSSKFRYYCFGFHKGSCQVNNCKYKHFCKLCGQFGHGALACHFKNRAEVHEQFPSKVQNVKGQLTIRDTPHYDKNGNFRSSAHTWTNPNKKAAHYPSYSYQ